MQDPSFAPLADFKRTMITAHTKAGIAAAVHAVMQAARVDGPQASPKGLRHGFGVAAVSAEIR